MRFLFPALSLLFFTNTAFAVDYYWYLQGAQEIRDSTPLAACMRRDKGVVASGYSKRYYKSGPTMAANGSATCIYDIKADKDGALIQQTSITYLRGGDGCTPPKIPNSQTQACETPPEPDNCETKAGKSTPVRRSGTRGDGYYQTVTINGKSVGDASNAGCFGGCEASVVQKCLFTISTDTYNCVGTGYFTGKSCVAAPATQLEESPTTDQREPQDSNMKEPCIYVQDAEGRNDCVSKDVAEKEGQNCGTYQGVSLCVPKQASLDEKKVETEVKEETKPDGSKQIVKKDVATETKCEGDKTKCTTKTTTTTTTTNKDGSGTTTKTETTCTGAKCGTTGGGGGGNGVGNGDCTTGDCGDDDITTPELDGDVPGFGDSASAFMGRVEGSPIVSAVDGISLSGNGSCRMSSTNTSIGTVSAQGMCDNSHWLDPLYFIFLACHALAAVRVFLSA